MWKNMKTRDLCYWQLHVSSETDRTIKNYLNTPQGQQFNSRSNLVQRAIEDKLDREVPRLRKGVAHDPLRLSHDLPYRKAEERAQTRRHVRWCVVLDRAVDRKVRSFLKTYGARHGARCRFVDDALRDLMGTPPGALGA